MTGGVLWWLRAQRLREQEEAATHRVSGHSHRQRVLLWLHGRDHVVHGGPLLLDHGAHATTLLLTRQ